MDGREIIVYCDESCHLESDNSNFMVIGAVYLKKPYVSEIVKNIKRIKRKYGYTAQYELKWTRIRSNNVDLAIELIDYFFDNNHLRFRGYIVDKTGLDHERYLQTHDQWYYKIFYRMLEIIIDQGYETCIYLDKKDTKSNLSEKSLKQILNNHAYPFGFAGISRIQSIQSHESQILQITDLIIGAIRYENENYTTSLNKLKIINHLKNRSGLSLKRNTSRYALKFNIFLWNMGSERGQRVW